MQPSETIEAVAMIADLWPQFKATGSTIEAYHDGLGDLDYRRVCRAIRDIGRLDQWPPSVGRIRDHYYQACGIVGSVDAWDQVVQAAAQPRQNPESVYRDMAPLVVQALRKVGGLSRLWMADSAIEVDRVHRDFRDAYDSIRAKELVEPVVVLAQVQGDWDGISSGKQAKQIGSGS